MSLRGGNDEDRARGELEESPNEPPSAQGRTVWEIQEIVAVALLAAVAVVALTGVASGIAGNTGEGSLEPTQEAIAEALFRSTLWAGVSTVFLLVASLGLIWWQVDGWGDALEDVRSDAGEDRDEPDATQEIEEGRRHIERNRALAKWAAVALLTTSAAAIGLLVGVGLETEPHGSLNLQQWLSTGGGFVATVILAGAGLFAVVHILKLCDEALPPR